MTNVKSFFLITAICLSTSVFALEDQSIDQKISSLKLEKMQAELMVATLLKRGHMNNEEASRIKREIASVKEQDIEVIKEDALDNLKSINSLATK